jgi:hypothetical protein
LIVTEIMIQRLQDQVEQLKGLLGIDRPQTERISVVFGLDIEQATVLGMLYRREFVTRDGLYTVMYDARPECDQPEPKILDIHMCRLRKTLKPMGIAFSTKWGAGWHMPAASKAVIRQKLEAHQAEISSLADRIGADQAARRRHAFLDGR